LLDVMTSERTEFLRRLPWLKMRLDVQRRMVEEFAGYLAAVRALAHMDEVSGDFRARIQIGVFRAHRILGAQEGKLRSYVVEEMAKRVLADVAERLEPPPVAWSHWIELLRKVSKQDARLRKRFHTGQEIHEADAGIEHASVGDWVWWPHAGQHIATIVAVSESPGNELSIDVACEPMLTNSVMASYVVGLR